MTQIVQKALDLLRPHRHHKLFPPWFVSEETRTWANVLFDFLKHNPCNLGPNELEEIKRIIDQSRSEVFQVVDYNGFTILQRAVIGNHIAVVKFLMKKGIDCNAGICSFPLHLACSLGHVHVAQLLLTSGAKADVECTVCYPNKSHRLKTCPDHIYCLTYQSLFTPVIYALKGDHDQALILLLHHENSRQHVKTDYLLHESCKLGAHKCSRYLQDRYKEQMSLENHDGKTPLQISLIMGAENAIVLMENGATVENTAFLTDDGSTLHELYKSKMTLGLVTATKFALQHGFRTVINVRDQEGNTALYVLLRHVGRSVNSSIQADFDREVEDCIKLLLQHGANPNIITRCGENALHSLLTDTPARPLYVNKHGQVMRLKPVLQQISKVTQILVEHGANAGHNAHCSTFIPPLFYAIKVFYSLLPDMFVNVRVALKQLFTLLCQKSLNMNLTDSYGKTPALHLLTVSYDMISKYYDNASFCKIILPFVGEVLQRFIKCGLDVNEPLMYWTDARMDVCVETHYFKEIVLLLNLRVQPMQPQYYGYIKQLLLKMIQRGGDVNLLNFTPLYGQCYTVTDEVPREASFACLLTRAFYVDRPDTLPFVLDVLNFFYHTLNQRKLVEFLDSITHYTRMDFKASVLPECVQQHLTQMRSSPRSLMEISRIAIAESVGWKIGKKVRQLPLPQVLIKYCSRF